MLDMLIQGGRVVTPAGAGDWDVGVIGEKIVSVAFPGVLPSEAKQVIDARGKIVVPGGIETPTATPQGCQASVWPFFSRSLSSQATIDPTPSTGLARISSPRSGSRPGSRGGGIDRGHH